jgi:tRNA-binding protein
MQEINWQDFGKIELRVGTIIEVEDFVGALKSSYKIKADFGKDIGIKKSSARITDLYKKEDLIGKKIIGVLNFPIKQIGHFHSEFLTTGFYREDGSVVLAVPDKDVPNGSKMG